MRIVVLENEPSSQRGGQELSLVDICEKLAARGHQIYFLYVDPGDLLARYEKFCAKILRVTGYNIDRARFTRSSAGFTKSFFLVAAQCRDADVIYANQYHDTLFGGLLAQFLHKPFVCHLRLPPPLPICGQYRLGLERATRFITISKANLDEWTGVKLPPDRIELVYNGIDPARYRAPGLRDQTRASLGLEPGVFTLIYVGRLDTTKGVELLLDGFTLFRERVPNCHLLVVGTPILFPTASARSAYFDALKERAVLNGVEGAVSWLGRRSDVNALCEASDVLVMPSRWPEAFGRSLIEAMSCGIPTIGSRVGGIPEIMTGEFDQYLFQEGSAAGLAEKLVLISDWRERDPDLSRRCREHVAHNFTLETAAAGVESVLLRAIPAGYSRWRGVQRPNEAAAPL